MANRTPTDEELRKQYGPDVEILRTAPSAKEIQEKHSWLELIGGTIGFQKWMWRSMTGRLLAVIIIPATISGYAQFWMPVVKTSYEYASPYITVLGQAALKLKDELILFGDSSGIPPATGQRVEQPVAFLVPRTDIGAETSEIVDPIPPYGGIHTFTRRLWRITRPGQSPIDAAASMRGGRWNSPGTRVLYTAEDPLGALGELRSVIARSSLHHIVLHELEVSGTVEFPPYDLLRKSGGSDTAVTRAYGDLWIETQRTSALAVPSVLDASRNNYILNPDHPLNRKLPIRQSITIDAALHSIGYNRSV